MRSDAERFVLRESALNDRRYKMLRTFLKGIRKRSISSAVIATLIWLALPSVPAFAALSAPSISAMQALGAAAGVTVQQVQVSGYNNGSALGGGAFVWASTCPFGSGTVGVLCFAVNSPGTGYWVRELAALTITPYMAGAVGDNSTNDTSAVQAWLNACFALSGVLSKEVKCDGSGGTYYINSNYINVPTGTNVVLTGGKFQAGTSFPASHAVFETGHGTCNIQASTGFCNEFVRVENIYIDGGGLAGCWSLGAYNDFWFDHNSCVHYAGPSSSGSGLYGLELRTPAAGSSSSHQLHVTENTFYEYVYGDGHANCYPELGGSPSNCYGTAISIAQGQGDGMFDGNTIGYTLNGIYVNEQANQFINNHDWSESGMVVDAGASGTVIIGAYVDGNSITLKAPWRVSITSSFFFDGNNRTAGRCFVCLTPTSSGQWIDGLIIKNNIFTQPSATNTVPAVGVVGGTFSTHITNSYIGDNDFNQATITPAYTKVTTNAYSTSGSATFSLASVLPIGQIQDVHGSCWQSSGTDSVATNIDVTGVATVVMNCTKLNLGTSGSNVTNGGAFAGLYEIQADVNIPPM
jgi:hypothetical protein